MCDSANVIVRFRISISFFNAQHRRWQPAEMNAMPSNRFPWNDFWCRPANAPCTYVYNLKRQREERSSDCYPYPVSGAVHLPTCSPADCCCYCCHVLIRRSDCTIREVNERKHRILSCSAHIIIHKRREPLFCWSQEPKAKCTLHRSFDPHIE